MNIPAATDAKAATLEARARKQQAALDEQAALIERRIHERIAEGQCGFPQVGRIDQTLKAELERQGYFCQQVNHPDGDYYTVEWEAPRRLRA